MITRTPDPLSSLFDASPKRNVPAITLTSDSLSSLSEAPPRRVDSVALLPPDTPETGSQASLDLWSPDLTESDRRTLVQEWPVITEDPKNADPGTDNKVTGSSSLRRRFPARTATSDHDNVESGNAISFSPAGDDPRTSFADQDVVRSPWTIRPTESPEQWKHFFDPADKDKYRVHFSPLSVLPISSITGAFSAASTSSVSIASSTFNVVTHYQVLCQANAVDDLESVKDHLIEEWKYTGGFLVGKIAVDATVFGFSSGSLLTITTSSLRALVISAASAALGLLVVVWLFVRCSCIDGEGFKRLAKGSDPIFLFFSLKARLPAFLAILSVAALAFAIISTALTFGFALGDWFASFGDPDIISAPGITPVFVTTTSQSGASFTSPTAVLESGGGMSRNMLRQWSLFLERASASRLVGSGFATKVLHSHGPGLRYKILQTRPVRPRTSARYISFGTLDRRKLRATDYVELAGLQRPTTTFKADLPDDTALRFSHKWRWQYASEPGILDRFMRFPPDARGFLYYHPPTSPFHFPRLKLFDHGHIRLRKTSGGDPALFDEGSDLLLPSGAPWSAYTGLSWRHTPRALGLVNTSLSSLIISEGLASTSEIARWFADRPLYQAAAVWRTHRQPLLLDFTSRTRIDVNGEAAFSPSFQQVALGTSRGKPIWKSGVAVCRFEPLDRDESGKVASLGLRVLQILEPFVMHDYARDKADLRNGLIPTEGALYLRPWRSKRRQPVVVYRFTTMLNSRARNALVRLFATDHLEQEASTWNVER
ncbi:hypothetical protein K488DRAFT_82666 [Vararia minispora EC-137]|uniref:Uncharacterized protein n=1 Tax=Vararia minispora EC-137 TaxID=1314806 RepID=A0ACB8QW69_9AGAM|nr:hypothetical protein K488DRAFT_82666 [Vararia minispora EC-137]